MENEINDVDINNEEVLEEGQTEDQTPEEKPERKEFTPEQQLAIHKREAKKLEKQLGIDKSEPKSKSTKSDSEDYGQLAYLKANGVENDAEIDFIRATMADTGKSLRDVMNNKFVQAELKEMREATASQNAIPKGTKRTSTTDVNNVDYWIAKGEMPPDTVDNRELRAKIVNEEIRREKNKSVFGGSSKIIIQ